VGRNVWGQEAPEPNVYEEKRRAIHDSGLVDHLGRNLVREKVVGFKPTHQEEVKED
jgi:hypothetical protein